MPPVSKEKDSKRVFKNTQKEKKKDSLCIKTFIAGYLTAIFLLLLYMFREYN